MLYRLSYLPTNGDMLGWLENFVELFVEQAGIIKQPSGMSKILLCQNQIFISVPRVIGLVMKDGECAVDLLGGNDRGEFVGQCHGAEAPSQGGVHLF